MKNSIKEAEQNVLEKESEIAQIKIEHEKELENKQKDYDGLKTTHRLELADLEDDKCRVQDEKFKLEESIDKKADEIIDLQKDL